MRLATRHPKGDPYLHHLRVLAEPPEQDREVIGLASHPFLRGDDRDADAGLLTALSVPISSHGNEGLRQQGLDSAVIRGLNAYIDSRQRRRLREALRDVVAGASLGGTLYGSAGAIAGGILGLLGAAADEAGD